MVCLSVTLLAGGIVMLLGLVMSIAIYSVPECGALAPTFRLVAPRDQIKIGMTKKEVEMMLPFEKPNGQVIINKMGYHVNYFCSTVDVTYVDDTVYHITKK